MFRAVELLPEDHAAVMLFTRHSIREMVNGQGLAGYDLQLTAEGRDLAFGWGEYLTQKSGRVIQHCISSPIQRCIDTAQLMVAGAYPIQNEQSPRIEILTQPLLVEPGSFVVDIATAAPYFRQQGAVSFINSFVQNALPGMKHPINGVVDVLELLYQSHLVQCQEADTNTRHLSLAVSHDTILAAFIAVISGHFQVEQKDWPEMMEGLFLWFDDAPNFANSCVHWIWRGEHFQLKVADLMQAQN